jgi:hypothetical protein
VYVFSDVLMKVLSKSCIGLFRFLLLTGAFMTASGSSKGSSSNSFCIEPSSDQYVSSGDRSSALKSQIFLPEFDSIMSTKSVFLMRIAPSPSSICAASLVQVRGSPHQRQFCMLQLDRLLVVWSSRQRPFVQS